jgi:hypothetical protein
MKPRKVLQRKTKGPVVRMTLWREVNARASVSAMARGGVLVEDEFERLSQSRWGSRSRRRQV